MDIASLGFQIDTTGVRQATTDLNNLALAAERAQRGASGVRSGFQGFGGGGDGFATVAAGAALYAGGGALALGGGAALYGVGAGLVQAGRFAYGAWSLSNLTTRHWYPLQRAAKLVTPAGDPRFDLYSLRHFHASRLIASGVSAKELQVEMGHSSVQITFDTHGHLFPGDDARRRERAETMAAELDHQIATKTA